MLDYSEMNVCPWCKINSALTVRKTECSCKEHDWVYIECLRCGSTGPHAICRRGISEAELANVYLLAKETWNGWSKIIFKGVSDEDNKIKNG